MITIGADPEIPVTLNNRVWHCIGALGGSKKNPRKVVDGAVQEDNVAFEFNINPQINATGFSSVIQSVMEQGLAILGEGYGIASIASHSYSEEELKQLPKEAFTFGCDPDYNALTGLRNPSPSAVDKGLRSFGGHVHLGWSHLKQVNRQDQAAVIIACDYLLGLPSLLLDSDTRRRELYGKAGAFRSKEFGVEYRTLSNFWVFEDANRRWVFEQAQKAYGAVESGEVYNWAMVHDPMLIHDVINSNNHQAAEIIIKDLALA